MLQKTREFELHTLHAPHLLPHNASYKIIFPGGHCVELACAIRYSTHCYTRGRLESDGPEVITVIDALGKERVLCADRLRFSQRLPTLIQGLETKKVWRAQSRDTSFYRIEPDAGRDSGWTICFDLGVNDSQQCIDLFVRSSHYRTNRPDASGGPQQFFRMLRELYLRHQPRCTWMPPLPPRA